MPTKRDMEAWLSEWKPGDTHQRAVAAFLRRRSTLTSKAVGLSGLNVVARVLGHESALVAPWLDFAFEDLDDARDRLLRRGLQPNSVNTYMTAVKGLYAAARKVRLIDAARLEEVREIELVREESEAVRRVLTDDEMRRLLAACDADATIRGRRDAAWLVLMWCTGLRASSVIGLTVADLDLDLDGPTIRVRAKGNKRRTLPVAEEAAQALREWLVWRGRSAGPLFPRVVSARGSVSLQLSRSLGYGGLYKALGERTSEAGIAEVSPHTFRRTFATRLFDDGVGSSAVQWLMMHSDPKSTQRYNQRQREQAAAVVRRRTFLPADEGML